MPIIFKTPFKLFPKVIGFMSGLDSKFMSVIKFVVARMAIKQLIYKRDVLITDTNKKNKNIKSNTHSNLMYEI